MRVEITYNKPKYSMLYYITYIKYVLLHLSIYVLLLTWCIFSEIHNQQLSNVRKISCVVRNQFHAKFGVNLPLTYTHKVPKHVRCW